VTVPLWYAPAVVAAVLFAGCSSTSPAPAPKPAPAAAAPAPEPVPTCDADKAKFMLGQVATSQLEAEARARAAAQSVRTLKPNQAVTLEFNAGRLNLVVDARNRVTAVRCG
jgi:hypothetical protein